MKVNGASQLGFFSVFGLAKNPQFVEQVLPDRLGIFPRPIDFGPTGTFFFFSSYGDIVETDESIALKLGFVRSLTASPLSTKQLVAQKAIGSGTIDHRAFHGNALIASFSKQEPRFLAYKTIQSAPQLYYSTSKDGILCATCLRALVSMLGRVELNQDAIVPQLLFGAVPGPTTHLRNVYRLFPGELLAWKDGRLTVDLVQDLRFAGKNLFSKRVDSHTLDTVYEQFKSVIRAYISDIEASGQGFANLLSGGVDSSFVQLAINEERPGSRNRSFSYAVRVPSFEREIEYAERAASIFDTGHTFIDITEQEFPDLLARTTKILSQPVLTSAEVCKLGLVESVSQIPNAPRFFFVAQGADTLFGLSITQELKLLEVLQKAPLSRTALAFVGTLLKPLTRRGQTLLNLAEMLIHLDDPDHFTAPVNTEASILDFTLARRAFGDKAVRQALKERRDTEAKYLDSDHYTEKVHIVELLSDCYEIETQSSQLFLAHNREQLYPFLDEDVIRLSFAFRPEVRYQKRFRCKYITKGILEQKTSTQISRQPKGGSMFHQDLQRWMRSGPLHDRIREISLPGSFSRADFERLVENPKLPQSLLLWHLLAFDVFQKQVLNSA